MARRAGAENPAGHQSGDRRGAGSVATRDAADLERALAAAQRAWGEWRGLLPVQRSKILKKAADLIRARAEEIARIATLEMGKSIHETRIEVQASAEIFEWYGEEGRARMDACCRSACPDSA